jgi:hypothetical protein
VPKVEDLKRYYHEQFVEAERAWTKIMDKDKKPETAEQPVAQGNK